MGFDKGTHNACNMGIKRGTVVKCFFLCAKSCNSTCVNKHAWTLKDATNISREFTHTLTQNKNKHLPPSNCRLAALTFAALDASPGLSSHLAVLKHGI